MNTTKDIHTEIETRVKVLFPEVILQEERSWTYLLDCLKGEEESIMVMLNDFTKYSVLIQMHLNQPTILDYLLLAIGHYTGVVLWSKEDQIKNELLWKLKFAERKNESPSLVNTEVPEKME